MSSILKVEMPPLQSLPVAGRPDDSVPPFSSASRDLFRTCNNQRSFFFKHDLQNNPLMGLPSLLELSRRRPQNGAYAHWSNGTVGVDDRWDAGQGPRYSLNETIANIENNNSLVVLKHVEQDPVYGPFIHEVFERVIDLAGPTMRDDILRGRGTILIASPRRVTTYHIDSDLNYLFQIAGDKYFSVFDHNDRTLTTHEELENFFGGDLNSAVFKDGRQKDASLYDLCAGYAVHVPCFAAHWAQNRDTPSIALSINWDLNSIMRLGRIYRLNGKLRHRGWQPAPPGTSAWRDRMKLAALDGLTLARRLAGRASQAPETMNS
ncbi:MAG TPA: hypothetical protein VE058_00385 [Steroidobacteraceae bacterium]|nr:hypothetical protein [Steroidobacteraceae bacterium]